MLASLSVMFNNYIHVLYSCICDLLSVVVTVYRDTLKMQ